MVVKVAAGASVAASAAAFGTVASDAVAVQRRDRAVGPNPKEDENRDEGIDGDDDDVSLLEASCLARKSTRG